MTDLRPVPGSDDDVWGTKLLEWLATSIDVDGTLLAAAIRAAVPGYLSCVAKIAPSNATAIEKNQADYVCDGVDDHVEFHLAMSEMGANGGRIDALPGDFNGGQVVLQNKIWVAGAGKRATKYTVKNGVNAHGWINYVSADGAETNAEFVKISDICIDHNGSNQTAGDAVHFDANPSATKATNDLDFDPHNELCDVELLNAFQDGFSATSRSETRLLNVYSELANRYAFNPSYDTFLVACTAAHAGLAGFYCQSSSIRGVGCKAFYSGRLTAGSGRGLWLKSTHGCVFTGFEAQDNKDSGVLFDGSSGCVVVGSCDSNSTRGVGSAPAVDFFDADNNIAQIAAGERKADGTNSYQQNAVRFRTGCTGNDVTMTHTAFGAASIGAALAPTSDATAGNRVFVNAVAV